MTYNPMFAAEPFEESQGQDAKLASPDDSSLKAFYEDMEKRERLERKASSAKRKSQGHLFSRKSVKRSSKTAATSPAPEPGPSLNSTTTITASKLVGKQPEQKQDAGEMDTLEQNEKNDSVTSLPTTSIIPDALKELPAWYSKEDWSSTPSFKVRFPIHNPVGPRYYRNHHLIPPSVYRPGARPPSIFSPSFPAMGTSSMPERLDDATRLPVPSRTPSHSPLPTPSSSQTRVADLGIKPRSRKTSQSAHDNVDLLDVSDPWGTNWHHESPYDIGLASSGPIAADVDPSRSRRSSITTPARRKTVTPSPLSQSTSAIHLQAPLTEGSHMPRKLSKRRGLSGIFGSYGKTTSHSLPTSPVADILSQPHPPRDEKSKRASTMPSVPPSSHRPISAIKKDRRGSIIGRLTKRFSVTRKQSSTVDHESLPHTEDHSTEMRLAFNKSSEKLSKRVPPPSLDNIEVDEITLKAIHDPDRRSSISVEASFPATGKLMVANPDAPSSEISTPPQVDAPLPQANKSDSQPWRSADKRSSSGPSQHAPLDPSLSAVSYSPPSPAPAQNPALTSFSSSPLNGHIYTSDSANAIKSPRHGSASAGYSQRQSLDDNISHVPSERVISPIPSNHRRSEEHWRPRSPERGPPPPSSTTKPVPLPDVSIAPPPPSATTKPIPLPKTIAPPPPPATTQPIPVPHSVNVSSTPIAQIQDEYLTHRVSHLSVSQTIVEDSPLSAASMLVNPPTPQINDELAIPTESTASSVPRRTSSRDPSPGISSVTTRETETFKLVRTKSGNVQTACEIIPAAGEQWEVVEEVAHTRKSSKSKDQDRSDRDHGDTREKDRDARKESRRQEKKSYEVDAEGSDRRGKPSSRSSRQHSVDNVPQTQKTYSNKAVARSSSMESRSPAPASMRAQEETRSGRTRDGQRSNRKISGSHSASPTKPSSSSSTRPLERAPSKSARPTSELPSAADLNALRAREAWEMERLYKGHSMYGMEPNNEAVAPPMAMAMSASSVPTSTGSIFPSTTSKSNGATHGSSHTSFVVQNFASQGSATHIYHSMPTQPPPIIYAPSSLPAGHVAPASIASSPPRASSSSSAPSPPRASPSTTTTPSDLLSFIRPPNPLPEPPRETLTPSLARISQTFTDNSNTPKTERPSEYWTTFAEVSAAR
ncbi:hypothetical protein C8J55DRAFT_509305 [Lentinula edodes]|uniref:Uncharacterized protein n=1 Tax=Lentinula lateritia TaxID=40482 RepID=A0A9W9AKK2_9AGAR|nr:hypothetical protein C8J55DRAFT_509305 [Lentinula edodes]